MKTATTIQENAEDIYAEAVQINEDRAAEADAKVEESLDEEVSLMKRVQNKHYEIHNQT